MKLLSVRSPLAILFGLTSVLLLSASVAHAEGKSIHQAQLEIRGLSAAPIVSTQSHKRLVDIAPIEIKGFLPGEGAFSASLTIERPKTWKSFYTDALGKHEDSTELRLFRGKAHLGRAHGVHAADVVPIAMSLIGSGDNAVFTLSFEGFKRRGSSAQRLFTLKRKKNGHVAHVRAVPKSVLENTSCGADAPDAHSMARSLVAHSDVNAQAISRVADLGTDADIEWYNRFGDQSNAEIAAIVDAVEDIYIRDVGVAFDIKYQHVYLPGSGCPYTSTSTNSTTGLLAQFTDTAQSSADLSPLDIKHLFTGKDIDGSVVGQAWVGAMCTSYAAGYSQFYSTRSVTSNIVAHEMGHNFGANHETLLMAPVLNGQLQFSAFSINEINTYLASAPNCFTSSTIDPDGTPTPSGTASATPTATATATPTATATATATATPTPQTTPPSTPAPTATPLPSTPTATPTTSPTTVPTTAPTAAPTATIPSATPTPTPAPTDELTGARIVVRTRSIRGAVIISYSLQDSQRAALTGYTLSLLRNEVEVKTSDLDDRGIAQFVIRRDGLYQGKVTSDAGTVVLSKKVRIVRR